MPARLEYFLLCLCLGPVSSPSYLLYIDYQFVYAAEVQDLQHHCGCAQKATKFESCNHPKLGFPRYEYPRVNLDSLYVTRAYHLWLNHENFLPPPFCSQPRDDTR